MYCQGGSKNPALAGPGQRGAGVVFGEHLALAGRLATARFLAGRMVDQCMGEGQ